MPAPHQQSTLDHASYSAVAVGDAAVGSDRFASDGARRRALALAAALSAAVCAAGLAARDILFAADLVEARAGALNVFYRLFALHEAGFLWVAGAFAALMGIGAWYLPSPPPLPRWVDRVGGVVGRTPVWSAALGVLAVTLLGTFGVMHGIGLSMDEAAASFQARIFAAGRVTAAIPPAWHGLAEWMTPIFVTLKPAEQVWVAAYLPVYAALRAAFALARAEWLTNPALAATTVVLVAAVSDRLCPGAARARRLALLLLLTSGQFLVTSMSGYSMPAHLCLNLLWLYLYLGDDVRSRIALPWVGVLALGLHNPFPHALFAAPFLARVLLRRQAAWSGYYAAVYLAGAVAWYQWLRFAAAPNVAAAPSSASLIDTFALPSGLGLLTQAMNIALIASWQTPILLTLALAAVISWRELGTVERDLAIGVVATVGFYVFVPIDQGHGWGYRYVYGVLGSLVLLGARGADLLGRLAGDAALRWVITASVAASLVVQLPLRLVQVERTVRPYAAALEFIAARPEKLVLVDVTAAWYASDLVRNDPLFEKGPRTTAFVPARGPSPQLVSDSIRARSYVMGRAELARLGLQVPPAAPIRR